MPDCIFLTVTIWSNLYNSRSFCKWHETLQPAMIEASMMLQRIKQGKISSVMIINRSTRPVSSAGAVSSLENLVLSLKLLINLGFVSSAPCWFMLRKQCWYIKIMLNFFVVVGCLVLRLLWCSESNGKYSFIKTLSLWC